MSYSRWSNSRWYCFWSGYTRNKWTQVFCIDREYHFPYWQVKFLTPWVLLSVWWHTKASWPEMVELYSYMLKFCRDISTYDFKNDQWPTDKGDE